MTILVVSNISYAQEYDGDTANDYNTLGIGEGKEHASSDITDLSIGDFGVKKYEEETITTQGDVINYDVTEYHTAELLDQNTFSNDGTSEIYVVHSISEFQNFQGAEIWDDSGGIQATSVIYVEVTNFTNPDGEYWRLISSEGGWNVVDASMNTTNPIVEQGTSSMGRDELVVSESIQYTPTNIGSYNYNAPNWPYVNSVVSGAVEPLVGQVSYIDVYRGDPNNSWTLTLINQYNR